MSNKEVSCYCGSGKTYAECCAPYHLKQRNAETAEVLMRSRYSAFVVLDEDYLLESWHQSTRPAKLNLNEEPVTEWIGLKVVNTDKGTAEDSEGSVEFVARYKINGKAYRLHETSRFVKEAGRWYYVAGDIQT